MVFRVFSVRLVSRFELTGSLSNSVGVFCVSRDQPFCQGATM